MKMQLLVVYARVDFAFQKYVEKKLLVMLFLVFFDASFGES